MARIVYALSGQGRGHTSRAMAVGAELRARGHGVLFCGGGQAQTVLAAAGERVLESPTLVQTMHGNRLLLFTTGAANARTILASKRTIAALAEALEAEAAELLITDFDPYAHCAATRLGLPVVSLDHQQVVTETRYELPLRYAFSSFVASTAVRQIVPNDPALRIISTFFRPPLRDPGHAVFVPPILRQEVRDARPTTGDHVLVYYNEGRGTGHVVRALAQVDARFVAYNLPRGSAPTNVTFRPPSLDGFLADLASCRAVICTAGFTLLSEAISLGKPVLAVPNGGIFEQFLNAVYLEREGRGQAVLNRKLTAGAVSRFLDQADGFTPSPLADGTSEAVDHIEAVLSAAQPSA